MATLRPQQFATLIVLVSLAICAFFIAQGATGLAAAKLLALDPQATGATTRHVSTRSLAQRQMKSPVPILQRNIFEVPEAASATDTIATVTTVVIPGQEPPCGGDLRLVGAIVHPTVPDLSYAALGQAQSGVRLFRTGMSFGGKSVAEIDYDHVLLADGGGGRCKITMFGVEALAAQAPVAPPTIAATPQPPAQAEGELSADEIEHGITRVSDTEFSVSRALLDRALLQQSALFRTARLIPHEENGRVIGMKIYGIRRSSLLGRLGVQNGDTLSTVNGFDLQNADSMVEAYTRLRTAPEFSLSVVRRGTPTNLSYHVR